jgi:hypothetical protein
MKRILLFAIACSGLAACDHVEPLDVPGEGGSPLPAAVAPPSAPSFDMDEVDARDLIDSLGRPWSGKPVLDQESEDGFTGGYSDLLLFDGGSATIYTLPDGKVWRLRLTAGFGERCGEVEPLFRAYPTVASRLTGSSSAPPPDALGEILNADLNQVVDLEGAKVTASGKCVRTVTFSATS